MDSKSGTLPFFTLRFYFTLMALDNSIDHRQTQAYTLPLSGEERCEQLAYILLRNAATRVPNFYLELIITIGRGAEG